MKRCETICCAVMLMGGIGARVARAETRHVPAQYPDIQAAIDAAAGGDEVIVADGRWTGPGNKDLDFQTKAITIRSESGNRDLCVIDCEGDGRFAAFLAGDDAVVRSITIQNAAGAVTGGAVVVNAGTAWFEDCIIQDCQATFGAAFGVAVGASATIDGCLLRRNEVLEWGGAVQAGTNAIVTVTDTVFLSNDAGHLGGAFEAGGGAIVTVTDCDFVDNESTGLGGGLAGHDGARLIVTGSTFTGNRSTQAAGLFGEVLDPASRVSGCTFRDNAARWIGGAELRSSSLEEFSDNLFEGNSAERNGGGLKLLDVETRLQNVVFRENRARFGGGLDISGPPSAVTVVNCLFVDNTASVPADGDDSDGGGLCVWEGAAVTVVNSTFSGNTAGMWGGAVTVSDDARVDLTNCVLWGDDAPNGAEIRVGLPGFEGGTVTVSSSDVAGGEAGVSTGDGGTLVWGDGNIDEDPLFDEHSCLSAGSPAIDVGDDAAVPKGVTDDINGRSRFVDGDGDGTATVDMGACEFQTCPADLDRNGAVDFGDILAILAAWGNAGGPEDLDESGTVDFGDLLVVLAAWGSCG